MPQPVCDLVLLSWNHLEQTQPCLETLFQHTGVPSRLIIVDNGSEPLVREFLRTVKPQGLISEVVLLQNETNEGFPRGMNRGIRASSAPYVCLLNNDLRFSAGWLSELIAVASAEAHIGAINPMSDSPVRGQSLQVFAQRFTASRGQYVEAGMCVGFCMLIKRSLVEAIGGFNEEVERIFFEDEDFCMRANEAGYRCAIARGSYVYHAGHQTVRTMPEREALFARNQRWCHHKWGRWVRVAYPRFDPPTPGSGELRTWLETLLHRVRRRTLLYVYCPTPSGMTKDELFRSVDLVPHEDIHWQAIPHAGAQWAAAGFILKRRKKPLDLIASPDEAWTRVMQSLRWWHGAAVVPVWDEEQLSRAVRDVSALSKRLWSPTGKPLPTPPPARRAGRLRQAGVAPAHAPRCGATSRTPTGNPVARSAGSTEGDAGQGPPRRRLPWGWPAAGPTAPRPKGWRSTEQDASRVRHDLPRSEKQTCPGR